MNSSKTQLIDVSAMNFAMDTALKTTNKYRVIDTQDIVERTLQTLGMNASIESISLHKRNGRTKSTRHGVVVTLSEPVMLAGTQCFPRIYFLNSYAGETSLQVRVGFYRLVCSNGMMVGSTYFKRNVRHVESGVKQLDNVIAATRDAVHYLTQTLPGIVDGLNKKQLTSEQVMSILTAIGASQRSVGRIMPILARPEWYTRPEDRQADGTLSAWNVWNIINEQFRHTSRSQLRFISRDAELFDTLQTVLASVAA